MSETKYQKQGISTLKKVVNAGKKFMTRDSLFKLES